MPREQHIERQIEWKKKLQEYGCNVGLEKTIYINGAPIIVDVYAKSEDKTFLIEIGDIDDKRKYALIEYYAKDNSNIVFVHEEYFANKMQDVLGLINAYRNSPEYKQLIKTKLELKQQREAEEKKEHEKILRKMEQRHEIRRLQKSYNQKFIFVLFIVMAFPLAISALSNWKLTEFNLVLSFCWLIVVIGIYVSKLNAEKKRILSSI